MSNMSHSPIFKIHVAKLSDTEEAKRIDDFVRAHPRGTPFHLTAWSKSVQSGCGQKAVYLLALAGDGSIAALLPLTEVKSILFGKALASVGFAIDGGILSHSEVAARQLQEAAVDHARSIGIATVELRGGDCDGPEWHIESESYLGFTRDLAADDEAELLAIPRKQRAEVRKALAFDLSIEIGNGPKDIAAHYEVYSASVRNLGTPVFPRRLFSQAIKEFGEEADILTIRQNGTPIASVLSLYWKGAIMPYWGGGTAEARRWRANDLMYYALMLHGRKAKGCTRFDFGRSKVGSGPAAFKRNWGFEGTPLSYAKLALDGGEVRDINPTSAKYRFQVAAWQKLPLWLANILGPMISRGLG